MPPALAVATDKIDTIGAVLKVGTSDMPPPAEAGTISPPAACGTEAPPAQRTAIREGERLRGKMPLMNDCKKLYFETEANLFFPKDFPPMPKRDIAWLLRWVSR